MYSIGIVAALLGVCCKTLRGWDKERQILCYRTLGGHRRIPHIEIERILHHHTQKKLSPSIRKENQYTIYGRVSSHK